MSHSAGLSYGLFDAGTTIFDANNKRGVLNPATTLEEMIDLLSALPLVFHPRTSWEYSVATDVLARLIEIVSGRRFDDFLRSRIFGPLGMDDTAFIVPAEKQQRFARYYAGADPVDQLRPGLTCDDDAPYPGAYLRPFPRLSGGSAR